MSEFHRTGMGQTFFNRTMPSIADSLEQLARVMTESHDEDLSEYKLLLKLKFAVARQEGNSQEVKDLLQELEELSK